mmetsp:Transcript_14699/g.40071  ORF Transcript_14699/g.40071 Transcript_14699/m.40071 type:complete len:88 (+) Transcript_14699:87-350(+)
MLLSQMGLTAAPVLLNGRMHMMLFPCTGSDVYCNVLEDPSYLPLSEGADGNLRQYHVFEGMHPHEETWNVHDDGVDPWLNAVGGGIY